MNELNQSRLRYFGWDTLKLSIDNSIFEVPNNSILSELMYAPILNKSFIIQILHQYSLLYETAIKIKIILNRDNLDTFWQAIMEVIHEDKMLDETRIKMYEQLYVMLSFPTHRIDRQSQLRISDDTSTSIFQEFSNLAVKNIRYDLRNSLPSDILTKEFCRQKGIDYKLFKYKESILKYFWNILPQPFSWIPLYEKDSKWNDYTRSTFQNRMISPDDELLLPTDESLVIYEEQRNESERRMSALFSTYFNAKEYIAAFALMREENCPNFFTIWSKENDKKPSRNLAKQRHLRKEGMIESVLCQCQFCFRYRALPRKAGKYTWHCEEPECKKQRYRNWINDLNSKGIELENLYKR